jgi:short-subunit dehydrogenase
MRNNFDGKTVIVTGASSGIGRETALAFAEAGSNVVLAARRQDDLDKIVAEHPLWCDRLLPVRADVTRDDDVARLIDATISRFRKVDILVNNAGAGMRAFVADVHFEDARQLMELNFFGAVRCIQAVLPHMKQQGGGQIVNVGSVLSAFATPRNGIYCASKFALRALSNALRLELRPAGIEVILVMPGYTDTPFFDKMIRYDGARHTSPFKGQHPRQVARAILHACRRHKREVVLTVPGHLGVWMARFTPRLLDFALRRSV